MSAPIAAPHEWTELVAHTPGSRITAVEPFAGHLVLHEWSDATPRLRVLFRDGSERVVDTGADPCDVEIGVNPEYDTTALRFEYQSLVTPQSVYEEDVRTGERTLLKQTPVPGVDLSAYVTRRVWADAPDGTRVPMEIVHRADTPLDGTAPAVLYGYGAYEVCMAPWFAVSRLSLLDRGWVWVLAHPRGGGELGRRWYLDGRLQNKRNTFTDFIACAEHLGTSGIADPARIAIHGGSAGGLLVGACVTMRPDLFAAVVAQVPFVDVVTTMSDPSLPLTVTEWEQWGDPRAEPYASYILSYSPYDNTGPAPYPPMFVTAGLNDPRVGYQEPAKWVARLRDHSTSAHPVVMKVQMGAGHAGPSGRYDAWRETAQLLAFMMTVV
jgi:oligopeptidase B